ncbi:MAG: chaperone NapD [Thiohalocapsa sp.]|jgi:nitrate reductase NapD
MKLPSEPLRRPALNMTGNICSCVVHTKVAAGPGVAKRLDALPGVEVHAGAELDKLVVTVEDTPDQFAADTIGDLNQVPGVINATLVYHYGGDDIAVA